MSRRVFLRLAISMSIVPGAQPGAMIRSACGPATMRSAVAVSTGRFSATIPPNAERSSHSSARWYAVARSPASATPHGLACLMIATAG